MKRLLLTVLMLSSIAVYADSDCSMKAQKVVDRMHAHNKTTVQLNYSPDQQANAKKCVDAIHGLDSNINVVLKQAVSNKTGILEFKRPDQ